MHFLLGRQPSFLLFFFKYHTSWGELWPCSLMSHPQPQRMQGKLQTGFREKPPPHTRSNKHCADGAEAIIYLLNTSKLVSSAKDAIISDHVHSRMCSDQRVRENRTQVVVEKVEEHQHAAAHDYEDTDHDGGDVNRLFVLLLCRLVPLQLKVAPGGKQTPR